MPVHRYIMSFARAAQAAGYEVASFQPVGGMEREVFIDLRWKRSKHVAFRAWVETRPDARGERQEYGYVEQVHDPRTGRARLIDWTTLSTRSEFRLDVNGADKELKSIFRKPRRAA